MATDLIGPDGRQYHSTDDSPEALKQALAAGYRPLTAETPQTLGEKASALSTEATESVNAGLLGAAQGLTGNLYGAYLGHHGADETPEQAAQRKLISGEAIRAQEEHPVASVVGNLAGAIASPINKLAGGVEGAIGTATTAAKLIGKGLGSGAVGALYGAGNAVSDAALGDHELTAQKLLADGGLGGLIGVGAGGVFGLVEKGAQVAAPALKKAFGAAQEALDNFAPSLAMRAAGQAKKELGYLGEERSNEVGRWMLDSKVLGEGVEAPSAKGILESVLAKKQEIGKVIGDTYEAAEQAGAKPFYVNVAEKLKQFKETLSPIQADTIAADVKQAEEAVAKYAERDGGFRALNELKIDLQNKAHWNNNVGETTREGLRQQLSTVVRDELDAQLLPQLEKLNPELGPKFLDAKKAYGLAADAERVAKVGADKLGGNVPFGLRDTMLAVGAGVGHGNPITGLVTAIASKVMRERGVGVIARLADKIADSPQLALAAQSFAQKAGQAAGVMGKYGGILGEAAQRSPAEALATHMVLGQTDPHYEQVAQLAGFTPESKAEQSAALTKAHGLATMAAAAAHQDAEIDKHIAGVFKGDKATSSTMQAMGASDLSGKRMRRSDEDAHLQHLDDIRKLAANPEVLLDRVSANFGNAAHVAPGVAGAMTATAQRAVQYLAAAGEQPAKAGPLAPDWKHSDAERFAFAKKFETVRDPMSALRAGRDGTLTRDQVEALKAVYPRLHQQIVEKAMDKLFSSPKAVPYKARLMLGLMTGTDPDGTMGEAIARNQAAIQLASQKPSNPEASSGNASPSRADKLSLGKRTSTPSQARETREE